MIPAIAIDDITKTFIERSWRTILLQKKTKKLRALNGVSLDVQAGEVFGLLGPNGAGKTTLIKILSTLILPDRGNASICGYDLCCQSSNIRSIIGLVNTSERSFYWRLTGKQNLEFFAILCNLSVKNRKNRIEKLIKMVDLENEAETLFMKYSSGQKQRLAIARALLADPEVLLMDEPTNSLDPLAALELRKFIKEKLVGDHGRTILWCTHNLKEAEEMCDRVAIIHKGRIIASGSIEYMHSLIEGESLYQLKIASISYESLLKIGISPLNTFHNNGYIEFEINEREENIPFLMNCLVENGIMVYSCMRKKIRLEEVFERLIHIHHREADDTKG
jgi:ABC-2 type transport system ATP-binding protein